MLTKIFSAFCLAAIILFAANTSANAAKIAVVLDAPTGMFSEPEKVYDTVQKSLDKILKGTSGYSVMPISETESYVQIYREENNLVEAVNADGTAIETFLKKEDIDNICRHFDSDYVIYLRVSTTTPRIATGLFTASQKVNVTLDFRVWSNNKKDFSYTKRVTTTGSSTAVYAGIGSAVRAVNKGLKKGLQEVEKDSSKVVAALQN